MNARISNSTAGAQPAAVPIGSFSVFPGIQVLIFEGDAGDYLAMRAAQLTALMSLFASEGFEQQPAAIKSDVRWLASSLSSEINHLIPVALKEAATTPTA